MCWACAGQTFPHTTQWYHASIPLNVPHQGSMYPTVTPLIHTSQHTSQRGPDVRVPWGIWQPTIVPVSFLVFHGGQAASLQE